MILQSLLFIKKGRYENIGIFYLYPHYKIGTIGHRIKQKPFNTERRNAMIELKENKTFTTKEIKKFTEFVKEQDAKKKQELINFSDWEFTKEGLRIKKKTYEMRDSAMKTLLHLFKMPVSFYYETSPTDMLVRDVNRMKDEFTSDSQMWVYWQDKEIRAVSRPNIAVAPPHTDLFSSMKLENLEFKRGNYSDYGLRFLCSDTSIRPIKVEKGDLVEVGNEIMHSDIGQFPTTGIPFLNRLICTNGMVMTEKSPLVDGFTLSRLKSIPPKEFLEQFSSNLSRIKSNTTVLTDTLKAMKDHPVSDLRTGEDIMKKIRLSIGTDEFDKNEKLTQTLMLEGEKKKTIINLGVPLYDALDVTTRLAKKQPFLERRKTEGLCGSLVLRSANQFIH